jgi:nitroreductase
MLLHILLFIMDADKIKEPQTRVTLHPLLYKRWSPRAFSGQPVESEKLQRIFEAARWAPSSSNIQPWHFLVGYQEDEVYSKIFSTLVKFNQLWAQTAPVLVLAISKMINSKGEKNTSRNYDLGQAVAFLTLQATAEGLYVHQMGGFDTALAASQLGIPDDYEVRIVIAIGYRGDPELLHPNLKKLEYTERSRRPLEEIVFSGKFGEKAVFL